jgi:hypothetical protein
VDPLLKGILVLCGLLTLSLSFIFYTFLKKVSDRKFALRLLRLQVMQVDLAQRKKHRYQWMNHVQDQLIIARFPITALVFVGISGVLFLLGSYIGALWLNSITNMVLLGGLFALFPWLVLHMRLINLQMKLRLLFLEAVEIFYQAYVSVPRRNIRVVLAKIVSEQRMPRAIAHLFVEMHEQFIFGDERALHTFAKAISHEWGYTFTHLLEVAMQEGVLLDEVLQTFIIDLRESRKAALADKTRLIEIRMANFSPPIFLALFIGINLHFNYQGTMQAYFYDLHGRVLLLQAFLLMVASFVMGIWLSIQKS